MLHFTDGAEGWPGGEHVRAAACLLSTASSMSDASNVRPPHGALACVVLALLSLALAPLSLAFALIGASAARLGGGGPALLPKGDKRPTALVNGGRMQKSLYVVRALAAQGYRVVLVEERGWRCVAPRVQRIHPG